jgi:sigma-B regulation protein RsbU (phosphoserine phosphatase)
MSIRTKLLLVLVGFAIVPMVIAFGVGQVSTRVVSERLSDETQQELVQQAEDRLRRFVSGAAALVGAQALTVELIVAAQSSAFAAAQERTERVGRVARLGRALGALPDPGEVFFADDDFDRRRRTPPGLEAPPEYQTPGAPPFQVTFEVPSIKLAPGVDRSAVAGELMAHAVLTRAYKLLNQYDPGLLLFQYACSESGVHSAYPGHGGYPAGFDPRERAWYRDAAYADASGWTNPDGVWWGWPMVDAATGQAVITVSAPAVGLDGALLGVTAVDIRVADLMEEIARRPVWSPDEEIVIATLLGDDPAVGDTAMEIWVQRSYERDAADWRTPIDVEVFAFDDDALGREVIGAIRREESGVVRGERGGRAVLCAFAPIFSGGEETASAIIYTVPLADIVELAAEIDREFWSITLQQLGSNAGIALLVLAAVIFFAFRGSRAVTEPVSRLAEAVRRVASGDHDARAEVDRRDELGQLARDFNDMAPALRDRLRLRQSLDLAMEVQQSLLPSRSPDLEGFDIDGRSVYCDETGGDYYDYLLIDESETGRIGIAMGDVTGHGIAAALLMTTARALLRSRVALPGALGEQLTDINRHLSRDNEHGRFMTLLYLRIDRHAGEVRWASAGHDAAIVYDPHADAFSELDGDVGGIPLGVEGSWTYDEGRGPLPEIGSVVVLGTDGIWETRDARDRLYGKDRLRETVRRHAAMGAGDLCDAILADVEAFRGDLPQQDDITLVVIKRTGA